MPGLGTVPAAAVSAHDPHTEDALAAVGFTELLPAFDLVLHGIPFFRINNGFVAFLDVVLLVFALVDLGGFRIEERKRRDPYINHHFEVSHFSGEERDVIGFLGEFACCDLFGIDWTGNIRENYYSIDDGDIFVSGHAIDVKTETLPGELLSRLISDDISDDGPYGRRLINGEQVPLLWKYEAVVFGAFSREDCKGKAFPRTWYALGYASVKSDLSKYAVTDKRPYGGKYPTEVLPFRTSELRDIRRLEKWVKAENEKLVIH